MRRLPLFLFFLFLGFTSRADKYFEFTPNARDAYEKATSLRFREARSILSQIKLREPDNLIVYHIENYIDFFTIYINEDEEEFRKLKKNKAMRLDKIKKGDPNSPYYLFIQADIRLQWALARLKFEEYFIAFQEVSKAFKLLRKNQKKFPGFMPNKKDLGILHAMVGTIPANYKWGVKLLSGLKGTIRQGKQELEEVLNYAEQNEFIFDTETKVLYSFLLLHLDNQSEKAWELIQTAGLRPQSNPIHCFIMANIAMRTQKNDLAIELLEQRPEGKMFLPFPYLDFMLGLSKLRRLDKDADGPLLQYVQQFPGKNFIKESYQKLAWFELINDEQEGYQKYMRTCLDKGSTITGGDKNAFKEANADYIPDKSLVMARLLFDGGYYSKARKLLSSKSVNRFGDQRSRLEYNYRLGRILHGLKEYPNAIKHYQTTIDKGRNESYFFACNSALQAGLIYEALGNKVKAREYFKLCLKIKPGEYKTGLHQKAKAGLGRL